MATATHPGTATSEPIWFIDNLARVLVDGEESNGTLAIVELSGRQGDMPPLHVHHREDETFVVLEGALTLFLAGGPSHRPRGRRGGLRPEGASHTSTESSPSRHAGSGSRRRPASTPSSVRSGSRPKRRSCRRRDASTIRPGSARSQPGSGSSCSALPAPIPCSAGSSVVGALDQLDPVLIRVADKTEK